MFTKCNGLHYRVQRYRAVTQFVFRIYIAVLHQRPELACSRPQVLAFANT